MIGKPRGWKRKPFWTVSTISVTLWAYSFDQVSLSWIFQTFKANMRLSSILLLIWGNMYISSYPAFLWSMTYLGID